MVDYILCKKCGKVVDEFENFCHWCGTIKEEEKEKNKSESKKTSKK